MDDLEKPQKPQKFLCENCNFITSNKKDYSRHLMTLKHKKEINGLVLDEITIDSPSYYLAVIEKQSEILPSVSSGGFVSLGMSDFYGSPNNQFSNPFEFPAELVSKIEKLSKRMTEQDQVIAALAGESKVKFGLLSLIAKRYLRQFLRRLDNE